MPGTAEKVFLLVKETVEKCGVDLWDVRFLKEGASYYLRVFIDKDEGISIDDCTRVSHAIDPVIDAVDPIDVPYYLEVCSPGIERELTREEHFLKSKGKTVNIKLYKALNGTKQITGVLKDYNGGPVVETDDGTVLNLSKGDFSKAVALEEI